MSSSRLAAPVEGVESCTRNTQAMHKAMSNTPLSGMIPFTHTLSLACHNLNPGLFPGGQSKPTHRRRAGRARNQAPLYFIGNTRGQSQPRPQLLAMHSQPQVLLVHAVTAVSPWEVEVECVDRDVHVQGACHMRKELCIPRAGGQERVQVVIQDHLHQLAPLLCLLCCKLLQEPS